MRAAIAAFSSGFRRSSSSPDLTNAETASIDSRELVLQPGRQVNDKEIDGAGGVYVVPRVPQLLGETANSRVIKATDRASGDPCALKIVLRSSFSSSPSLLASLRAEAALASSFPMQAHPNLCLPLKVSESRTRVVVELDCVLGGDLSSLLLTMGTRRWLDDTHPGRIVTAVLRALEFCHKNGIAHGDVKPENVLLTRRPERGTVRGGPFVTAPGCIYKLCDFGVSRLIPEGSRGAAGVAAGTKGYMAPEVAATGIMSRESDMWSAGALIYSVLTGEMLYDVDSVDAEKGFHASPKKWLRSLPRWKKIGRGWRKLISELLVVDPDERLTVGAALQAECLPGRQVEGSGKEE